MSPERSVFKALGNFLFPAVKAEFCSFYSLPESIARLRAATDSGNPFSVRQTMQAEFYDNCVVLSRGIPFTANHYAPVFAGSFQSDGDRVVLRGQFRAKQWFIVYQYFGLAFVGLLGALTFLAAVANPRTAWWSPLPFLGLVALVVGQIRLGQWFGRNNAVWLSRQIGRTLGHPEDWPEPPPRPPGRWRRTWRETAGR